MRSRSMRRPAASWSRDERLERRPESGERADVAHRVEQAGALLDERPDAVGSVHRRGRCRRRRIGATACS